MCCVHVFECLEKIWGCYTLLESLLPKLGNVLCRKPGHLHSRALGPVKSLGRNVQLIKMLSVDRQEHCQYIFLGQKKI